MKTSLKHTKGRIIPLSVLQNTNDNGRAKIAISTKRSIELILVKHILYFKADGNYTEIHMIDGTVHLASVTLKKYADYVSNDLFMRVHQSYLIQHGRIKRIDILDNIIILENDQEVPVSRNNKRSLIQYAKSLMP